MNIGLNITNLRKEKNLTQEELANLINVSPKTISSYETNRSIPNIEILILLSKVLDTSINDILNLKEDNNNEVKKIYQKNNLKNNILKIIYLSIIFIVPIVYFMYAGYVSISSLTAEVINNNDIIIASHNAYKYFLISTIEFFIYYVLLIILNYILYLKKCFKSLLIINTIFFLIAIISIIEIILKQNLQYLVSAIFGYIMAYRLKKNK